MTTIDDRYMPQELIEAQDFIRMLREERDNLIEQVRYRNAYIKKLHEERPTIEVGYGFTGEGPFPIVIFTQLDYAKGEGLIRLFKTKDDLEAWAAKIAKPESP